MESWIVQVIISLGGVIGTLTSVIVILNKRMGNGNGSDSQKITSGLQHQVDLGVDGTKTLGERFESHLDICRKDWMGIAKFEGRVEQHMVEIRDRLDRLVQKREEK